ncbi:hypothetical protein ZHAS_00013891 [Anopheles sinensis]|uniref:Uncharacterized protein n=1 Tax=Anopheles sinensis TaxID=74873 RepID=A0A084W6T3_ANOSI|nr:hypothetical protein ZHAS_00013891 [Anopheles sinensis]
MRPSRCRLYNHLSDATRIEPKSVPSTVEAVFGAVFRRRCEEDAVKMPALRMKTVAFTAGPEAANRDCVTMPTVTMMHRQQLDLMGSTLV